ncbi:DMT family transporter [Agromyces silvae]|uniref:DMT family transporter n=1 Tax=Agromyces silvae TaxID=3388266 RepID=UPI00280B88E7|nr:DMT family transporter [Agromyces protaetiae]
MERRPSFRVPAPRLAGFGKIALAGVLWGTAPIAFEIVRDETAASAYAVSAARMTIAAVALLAVMAVTRGRAPALGLLRVRPWMVVGMGVGVAVYQTTWFAAMTYVGVSVATVVCLGAAPLLVIVWEAVRDPRGVTLASMLTLLIGVLGLVLVCVPGAEVSTETSWIGMALASVSAVTFATCMVVGRSLALAGEPRALTTVTTVVSALTLLPFLFVSGTERISPGAALALTYLGVVTLAVGYLLLYSGLQTVRTSSATLAALLEPATATVLAVWLLGEVLTGPEVAGVALILVALVVAGSRDE